MSIIDKFTKFIPDNKPKDETTKEVMSKSEVKKNKHHLRTMGNVTTIAEAQRVYNPNLPPTKPKAPTAAQMEVGSSPSMGTEGNWGTPERMD
jgi:hypothetical protein